MIARLPAVLMLVVLAAHAARAADEPTALQCTFNTGQSYVFEKGQFVLEKVTPLTFGIASINAQAQTADLITERGTGTLRLVHASNATHFLEVVTEGWLPSWASVAMLLVRARRN